MPTKSHQKIVQYLLHVFLSCLANHSLGDAGSAPYRVRLRDQTFREPDIVVYLAEHLSRFGERFGEAPDIVVEVVSDDAASRTRDYEDKRRDYAGAGIPEYWIVDPAERRIAVLSLEKDGYEVAGEFGAGDTASSKNIGALRVDVARLLRTGED